MSTLSIRWRLSLVFALAVAGIVIAFGIILILITRQQLLARTDAALREELRELLLEAALHQSVNDFQTAAQTRFYHHDIYDFAVVDQQDSIVFVSAGLTPERGLQLANDHGTKSAVFSTHQLSESSTVRSAQSELNSKFGNLRVFSVTSLQPLLTEMRTLQTVAACLVPVWLIIAVGVGYTIAGRALAPVTAICETANAITIDSLHRRIEVPNPHDELGTLAETLNSLIARLDRAVGEIKRFTADASHELRTPLAALKLEAELALRNERSPHQYRASLGVIVEETNRLCRLADQLLNLSREDAGVVQPMEDRVPLHAVLSDLIQQLQPRAFERSIKLTADRIYPCEVIGNDIRLRQVFLNLLENALKFTQANGSVRVQCECHEDMIVCGVQDTGTGIAAEHLPLIFGRFYRADMARNCESGGVGLGLSIAQRIVKAHGGTIDVCSEVNCGTSVVVTLPGRMIPSSADTDSGSAEILTAVQHSEMTA
ncbi:MAG: HAMP domain-containing protein [Planctomycetota bacterium]|nr:MAG: HAMP domain-containing protein [Planctomycetota bacterium]